LKFLTDKTQMALKEVGIEFKYPKRTGFRFSKQGYIDIETPFKLHSGILQCNQIGAYTYLGNGEYHSVSKIGRFCSIAGDQKWGLREHSTEAITGSPIFNQDFWLCDKHQSFNELNKEFVSDLFKHDRLINSKQIVIGNDVWIGDSVFIKRGVTVGDGAVVAARSVVTKDIEPYSIVGGVPARHIKYRFNKDVRDQLISIQWWNKGLSGLHQMNFDNWKNDLKGLKERVNLANEEKKIIRIYEDFHFDIL